MGKQPVGPQTEGSWSSLPKGKTITQRPIVVFQHTAGDGRVLERFAVQACGCEEPMVEYIPQEVVIELPGVSHHDTPGKPQEGSGWVIWCDDCGAHAGPHEDRERTIKEWNEAIEGRRVLDAL